jgi:prepilin-type N-terminal cleavage/methylation domain-containing protein/prepilin-type processing-associated H-X9-DG protein
MSKRISKKNMKRRAFTLIELLVVISIIALLLSILMPSLSKVKQMGRQVVCLSNYKQIGLGMQMYQNEYDRYPNSRNSSLDDSFSYAEGGALPSIIKAIRPYYFSGHSGRYFFDRDGNMIPKERDGVLPVEECPADKHEQNMTMQTYMTHLGFTYPQKGEFFDSMPNNTKPKYYSHWRSSEVPILFESDFWWKTQEPPRFTDGVDTFYGPIEYGGEWFLFQRHPDSVNMAFLDGHAEKVKPGNKYCSYRYLQWLHRHNQQNWSSFSQYKGDWPYGPHAKPR